MHQRSPFMHHRIGDIHSTIMRSRISSSSLNSFHELVIFSHSSSISHVGDLSAKVSITSTEIYGSNFYSENGESTEERSRQKMVSYSKEFAWGLTDEVTKTGRGKPRLRQTQSPRHDRLPRQPFETSKRRRAPAPIGSGVLDLGFEWTSDLVCILD